MKGNAAKRSMQKTGNLPCAGITLIRFYGYDLSLSAPRDLKHKSMAF
jgi:hypothetical protein